MTARTELVRFLLFGPCTQTDADELADAYRAEVITKAVGRLRAVPVTCTALTGPVWYGDGWNSAITTFEEIADYQRPDDEAYPGELQKLRALNVGLRAALLRRDDVAWARQQLISLAEHESREHAGQPADFFLPGRTYTSGQWGHTPGTITHTVRTMTVTHIETAPDGSKRVAIGWEQVDGKPWLLGVEDMDGWTLAGGEGE